MEFRSLKPEGVVRLYETLLMPLVSGAQQPSGEFIEKLKDIKGLTPGDFANVRERFLFVGPENIKHEDLLGALKAEVRYKETEKRISGFVCQ